MTPSPHPLRIGLRFAASFIACATLPSCALAQGQGDEAVRRAECEQAVRFIDAGSSHPRHEWAMERIAGCRGAATALRDHWVLRAPSDSAELRRLTYSSMLVRDRTLMEALISLMSEPARPLVLRRASLEVVLSFWRAGAVLPSLAGSGSAVQDVRLCGVGMRTHFTPTIGDTPLLPEDSELIRLRIREVAQAEQDPAFKHALECTWHGMTRASGALEQPMGDRAALLDSTGPEGERGAIRRAECARALRDIDSGPSHPQYAWAIGRIAGCPAAARALLDQWQSSASKDSAQLGGLAYASSLVRDRILMDGLLIVVGDGGRPLPERRASLDVLVSFWRPGALTPLLAGSPEQQDVHLCVPGIQTHFDPKDGDTPLVAEDAGRISLRLGELAAVEALAGFRHALSCTWHAMTTVPAP